MTVVREFIANAQEGPSGYKAFVRGKEVRYDTTTINNLLHLQYNPTGPDEGETLLNDDAKMPEVTRIICQSRGTQWAIMKDEHTHFPSKDLYPHMKVWHHFIYARLLPTMHLSEVTKEQAVLLYGIQMGQKINVGRWVQSNISHAIYQGSGGIPHPTLLTELIAAHCIYTSGTEVLKPKGPLNQKAIERIIVQ